MRAILKQLVVDFVNAKRPKPIPRDVHFPGLPSSVKKAFVLIGMRRTGKTWCMYQEMDRLSAEGFEKEQLIYLNFEDDRLIHFKNEDWSELLPACIEAFPNIMSKKIALFLDEVHAAQGWEKFVLRLIEQEHVLVYLSGSSAKMLSKEIATHLRGRTLVREVFPMSFHEVARAKGLPHSAQKTTQERAQLHALMDHYLCHGGFPETLEATSTLRIELIQNYIESVVYRDVVERHHLTNISAVRQFIFHAIKNSGSLLSINKIYQAFKSQGISVSKNALYDYAQYFEDAYCLFFVPEFQFSLREQHTKPLKVYPIDPGVITAYSIKPHFEISSTFETAVFLHLRRQFEQIFYYRTSTGKEVDFIVQSPQGELTLYQACVDMDDPNTSNREIRALTEAMETLELKESYIITQRKTEDIPCASGIIHCVSFIDL